MAEPCDESRRTHAVSMECGGLAWGSPGRAWQPKRATLSLSPRGSPSDQQGAAAASTPLPHRPMGPRVTSAREAFQCSGAPPHWRRLPRTQRPSRPALRHGSSAYRVILGRDAAPNHTRRQSPADRARQKNAMVAFPLALSLMGSQIWWPPASIAPSHALSLGDNVPGLGELVRRADILESALAPPAGGALLPAHLR